MMNLQELMWVSVKVTSQNKEDFKILTDSLLSDSPYVAYHLTENRFTGSMSVLEAIEEIIPDFSKLPEIRLLISLGMSHREAFKNIYGDT